MLMMQHIVEMSGQSMYLICRVPKEMMMSQDSVAVGDAEVTCRKSV